MQDKGVGYLWGGRGKGLLCEGKQEEEDCGWEERDRRKGDYERRGEKVVGCVWGGRDRRRVKEVKLYERKQEEAEDYVWGGKDRRKVQCERKQDKVVGCVWGRRAHYEGEKGL